MTLMASSSSLTLDDLAPPHSVSAPHVPDEHLFYPTLDDEPAPEKGSHPPADQRPLLKDRLYIGNLHPSVDEYTLLQVFSKFGKVTKLDWLYHKTGLLKGKPRGYAFVEYANKDDALKALTAAHDKPLRGRKLIVTFAHQAPLDQYGGSGTPSSFKSRKTMMDVGRPTALSMIKTGIGSRHGEGKTKDKIAILEAKLRQMESTNSSASNSNPSSPHPSNPDHSHPPSTTTATATTTNSMINTSSNSNSPGPLPTTLPTHPSLPSKPPAQVPGAPAPVAPRKLPPPPPMPTPMSMGLSMSSSKSSNINNNKPSPLGSSRLTSSSTPTLNLGSGSIFPSMMPAALGRVGSGEGGGKTVMGLGGGGGGGMGHRSGKSKLVGVKIKTKKEGKGGEGGKS